MKQYNREQFMQLMKDQRVKPRLVKEIRFSEDFEGWDLYDMLAIEARGGREGVLFINTDDLYMLPYELRLGIRNKLTGRSTAITCDFCFTWQQGTNAARITFRRQSDKHSFTFLCCGDLKCSLHVKDLTPESLLSRTNLREDITIDGRIARQKQKLTELVKTLELKAVE